MPDLLVSLLDLPPVEPLIESLRAEKIIIRRAFPFEITPVQIFVRERFGPGWTDELIFKLWKSHGHIDDVRGRFW